MKETLNMVCERLDAREKFLVETRRVDVEFLSKLRKQILDLQVVTPEYKDYYYSVGAEVYNENLRQKKETLKKWEDQIKDIDTRLNEIGVFKRFINDVKVESDFNVHVYDVLVFESAAGDIYQDCVCSTEKENIYGVKTARCNNTLVYYTKDKFLTATYRKNDELKSRGQLIEIWSRSDDQTFKKIWSKE